MVHHFKVIFSAKKEFLTYCLHFGKTFQSSKNSFKINNDLILKILFSFDKAWSTHNHGGPEVQIILKGHNDI